MQSISSTKYSAVMIHNNRMIAIKGYFDSDDITDQIQEIEVIECEVDDPHKAYKMAVVGGLAGGWIGAAASTLLLGKPRHFLNVMIHLHDETTVEIKTTQLDTIKFVLKWFKDKL